VRHLFFFPARIDDAARFVAEILGVLGEEFDSNLVQAAVHEAIVNAIVYGVLRIPPPTGGRDLDQLMGTIRAQEKTLDPSVGVSVSVCSDLIHPREVLVTVRDPGPGFDWREWLRTNRKAVSPSTSWSNIPVHGRGLVIMQGGTKQLSWNESGNEVTLRLDPGHASTRPLDKPPGARARSERVEVLGAKVLLVDDHHSNVRILTRAMQAIGCEVRASERPDQALLDIQAWQPSVVLVNARISGLGGIDLLRRIRQLHASPHCSIIVFSTGQRDPSLCVAAREAGAFDFLQLPLWKVELAVRVRRAIQAAYPIGPPDPRAPLTQKPT
jgi:CheY-like chemotaxis protein